MDIVTHAVTGGIAMLALRHPRTAWAVPLAMLAAMSPDADVFVCSTPLDFLRYHRGLTHSLAGGLLLAVLLALAMFPLWHQKRSAGLTPCGTGGSASPTQWSWLKTFAFAYFLVLLHIWLDCFNSYGTQIFLPFSAYRVRLNALFIVDLLFLLPMLAALLWGLHGGRAAKKGILCALAWIFIYPVLCLALRYSLQDTWAERFAGAGEKAEAVTVLADAFAPCYWKVVRDDGVSYYESGFSPFTGENTPFAATPKAPPGLLADFVQQNPFVAEYVRFSMFLVLHGERPWQDGAEYGFRDLRFGSRVPFIRDLNARLRAGDVPLLRFMHKEAPASEDWWFHGIELFDLLARCDGQNSLLALRFFGGRAAADTGWQGIDADLWR